MDWGTAFSTIDIHFLCLCFNAVLIIIYFSKKRVITARSRIFVILMISTFVGTLIDIVAIASIVVAEMHPMVANIVCKLYLVMLVLNVNLIVLYMINLIHEDQVKKTKSLSFLKNDDVINDKKVIGYEKTSKFMRNICFVIWPAFIIEAIVLFILPVEFSTEIGHIYDYGKAIDFTFYTVGVLVFILFIFVIFKWRYMEFKSKLNFAACVVVSFLCVGVQTKVPEVLMTSFLITALMLIVYFTVQNPDLEIINQLNEAKRRAEIANEQKTDFLLSMSHEIRTPLNAVVGYTEILKENNKNPEISDGVDSILIASNSLLDIIASILDISKIETNKLDIENSTYSFKRLYKELITLASSRIEGKPIEFRAWMDPNIPDNLIGDYVHTKQVILNILTNAIKYTKEGFVDFKVNGTVSEEYCSLRITVEDSGIGIKKENLGRLFGKFDRLDVEDEMVIEGTGLGLAITKKLISLMGGKITVQSIYGKGSKFILELKQGIDDKANLLDEQLNSIDRKSVFPGKTILLVDDNKTSISVVSKLLEKYNVNVLTASSGEECLNCAVFGSSVDLIFIDDVMPGISGTKTLEKLHSIEGFEVPVVMLTANAITGMREKYIDQGFNEYMTKPIDIEELDMILNKFLK